MSTTCVCERANNPPPSLPSFIHSFFLSLSFLFLSFFLSDDSYYYWDDWSDGRGRAAAAPWARTSRATKWSRRPEPGHVLFTYDVTWKQSKVHWASRWDIYLSMDGAVSNKVHWFSIFNSLIIVVLSQASSA